MGLLPLFYASAHILRDTCTPELFVKCIDGFHLNVSQLKVEDIGIGSNAVRAGGFGNYGDSLLNHPTETDLSGILSILGADSFQGVTIQVGASCQRGICLNCNTIFLTLAAQL